MWWAILKSDIKYVFNPNDSALGAWNPKTRKITINLPAVKDYVYSARPSDEPKRKEVNDRMFMRAIFGVIEHETLHESLDEVLDDYIEVGARKLHDSLGLGANFEGVKDYVYHILYVLLQEYAVRFIKGVSAERIMVELSTYHTNMESIIDRESMKLHLSAMLGDKESAESLEHLRQIIRSQKEWFLQVVNSIADRTMSMLKSALDNANINSESWE